MRSPTVAVLISSTLLVACAPRGASSVPARDAAPGVQLELTDVATGRRIYAGALRDGERAVLTWTNSLFRLPVADTFEARGGHLVLIATRYGDPSGREPPLIRPEEAPDRVQTGGPFRAEGLSKRVDRIVFRVGEVGRPTFHLADREIRFHDEVGFGGAIRLEARSGADR